MGVKAYKAGSKPKAPTERKADSTATAIAGAESTAMISLALPSLAPNPTTEQFSAYQAAFDYFNRVLFAGELRPVILNFSRKAKSLGFFAPIRWGKLDAIRHEISLNPMYLAYRPMRDTMSTLVHEMAHLWQQDFGKNKSRGGYHNREWGSKMESIGLMPSHTGAPGGKRTGDRMTHYIIEGGPFAKAFDAIPAEYLLPWSSAEPDEEKKPRTKSKLKYTCPGCECNAWAKPNAKLKCGGCDEEMEPEEIEDEA